MDIKKLLSMLLLVTPLVASGQHIKEDYIDWGICGTGFPGALEKWEKGTKWSADDNFFISRVKPKTRFRNEATQVNSSLNESNDKKLIFWVPVNYEHYNALPDGVYDREVFPMWSYITHYGNWSTPLVRIPGNFIDVAHKNGVPVSPVASIPWGNISSEWKSALQKLIEVGPEKMADYLEYYGVDGLGYNSEFASDSSIPMGLADLHEQLVKLLKNSGRMPLAENIWYDGTNESGRITFDNGLGSHNDDLWGYGDNIKTSLFFNYNWNNSTILNNTIKYAQSVGRTPLDLYCGINMQGKEPHNNNPEIWSMLVKRPLSIGLWGAHAENMFFESRAEKGSSPETQQRTYMLRMERWFTGGTRNPVNTPPVNNSLKVTADNTEFFGMSKLMTARSALKWDLSDEPFITYFNLGNGKFFNYCGVRQHSKEWYNIGMQDYLPTWMWWFADKFMGRDAADVPENGLDAEFVWDDAWMGGSLVRVYGSSQNEYLHLFKTEFNLQRGDIITLRYKVVGGSADASLSLSVKGNEDRPVDESKFTVMHKSDTREGLWRTVSFTVDTEHSALEGQDLAMVALHFRNADNLDLRLGQFSIIRGNTTSKVPATPVIERTELLAANHNGVDGKIIFNMPNDKGNNVCYNIDVNTSLFKIYVRQKGKDPVLMGMTPSWAALVYSAPVDYNSSDSNISFGVSALSLDMTEESPIAWSDEMDADEIYEYSDEIAIDRKHIATGDPFSLYYLDPRHESGEWILKDSKGKTVASASGVSIFDVSEGISNPGNYDLTVIGYEYKGSQPVRTTREFPAFVQIADEVKGRVPEIISLTADGKTDAVKVERGDVVEFRYEGTDAEGSVSRGVRVDEAGFGFSHFEAGHSANAPFSVSFWMKPEDFKNKSVNMLSIRDKEDAWPRNNWGWFWHTLNEDGTFSEFTIRTNDNNLVYDFGDVRLLPGVWQHVTYVFDFDASKGVRPSFFLNGKEMPVKSYTRGSKTYTGDDIKYETSTYTWRKSNVIALGGYLHKTGSVRANIDNFMYWDKALDAAGVAEAMGDIDKTSLPSGLRGFFDFESNPDNTWKFVSEGSKGFKGGMIDYEATEVEGQGTVKWVSPEFCAGSPYISDNSLHISGEPEWSAPSGKILSSTGDSKSGSARIQFPYDGQFDVELRLHNEYGESHKIVTVSVGGGAGIEAIAGNSGVEVLTNPFDELLKIRVGEEGFYEFMLYDLSGRIVGNRKASLKTGDVVTLRADVSSGLYMLNVMKDGHKADVCKVIRR